MVGYIRRYILSALALCLLASVGWAVRQASRPRPAEPSFAATIAELSEPGGYFDTDNLISNEKSYLQVIPQLEQKGVAGGVYIGVGPDQNFSYIARIRPAAAFIIDIRRDNLLLHLLFKALFAASQNRVEFLSLLTGRPVPDKARSWRDAGVDQIIALIDGAKPVAAPALEQKLDGLIRGFGVPLSPADMATIHRFHQVFIDAGLSLRFQSFGREPQSYDPSYRELLLETDASGRRLCYLSSEDDFQFVRSLEARGLVIPVVGDVAGPHALGAVAQWMEEHDERLSAFYISNVENYLFREGSFERYMENLKRLPHTDRSVVIRSVFGRKLPESLPGYYSTSTARNLDELLANFSAGKYQSYADLLSQ